MSATAFQDRTLSCRDCRQDFTFTAGEQEFYQQKGFVETPKRCKPCRDQRKVDRGEQPSTSAPQREMFETTCSGCGGAASVPFRPSPGRSVYCRSCHQQR